MTTEIKQWLKAPIEKAVAVHSTNIYAFFEFLKYGHFLPYEQEMFDAPTGIYLDVLSPGFKGTLFESENSVTDSLEKIAEANRHMWARYNARIAHLFRNLPFEVAKTLGDEDAANGTIYEVDSLEDYAGYKEMVKACKANHIEEHEVWELVEESCFFNGIQIFFGEHLYTLHLEDSPDAEGDELITHDTITPKDIISILPLGPLEWQSIKSCLNTGKPEFYLISETLEYVKNRGCKTFNALEVKDTKIKG